MTEGELLARIDERTYGIQKWCERHDESHTRWFLWAAGASVSIFVMLVGLVVTLLRI